MKQMFHTEVGAVLDLCPYFENRFIITRISVPRRYRGKGHGSSLLSQVCEVADKEGVTLCLQIAPYTDSPLQFEDLRLWYERYGFKQSEHWGGELWVREPESGRQETPSHDSNGELSPVS